MGNLLIGKNQPGPCNIQPQSLFRQNFHMDTTAVLNKCSVSAHFDFLYISRKIKLFRHGLILSALAPTLKDLHIFFEGIRLFLLPSVNFPQGYGSYSYKEFANERLLLLYSLRRLRLTRVHPRSKRQHIEHHGRLCS